MEFVKRLNSFLELGSRIKNLAPGILDNVIDLAHKKNKWFTPDNIRLSFEGLAYYLREESLQKWIKTYDLSEVQEKRIGVVMAGNIPMVGIHDFICVLISGHALIAKPSNQDDVLLPFIASELIKIEPDLKERIVFVDHLGGMDAVIATGSDNTARYFDYYFSKYPNIIRKNRTSVAILDGQESSKELKNLGKDVFSYFGMGCRNVSKIFLPKGYDVTQLITHLKDHHPLIDHSKYSNNYFYRRSIFLVNRSSHMDSGFAIFQENKELVSPISVVFYEFYEDINALKKRLTTLDYKIQCIISHMHEIDGAIPFGHAQMPEIWDYADNIDTLEFLIDI